MPVKIRLNIFETNSSSSHNLTFISGMSDEEANKICREKGYPCLSDPWTKLMFMVGTLCECIDDLEYDGLHANEEIADPHAVQTYREKLGEQVYNLKILFDSLVEEYANIEKSTKDLVIDKLKRHCHNQLRLLRYAQFEFYHLEINESNFITYEQIMSLLEIDEFNEIVAKNVAKKVLADDFKMFNVDEY